MNQSCGILYICTGEEFIEEAKLSAQSVRECMPEYPIAIIADREIQDNIFDETIKVTDPSYDFDDQINYLTLSPFERTLFLDSDIYVEEDVSDLFDLLDQFDIAAAHNHDRSAYEIPDIPLSFPEYNTGVLLFRTNSHVKQLVELWDDYYSKFRKKDNTQNQPAFRKALYESDVRLATLRPEDNLMLRYAGHSIGKIRIFHGRMMSIDTPGSTVQVENDRARELLNSTSDHRVWIHKHSAFGRDLQLYEDYETLGRKVRYNMYRFKSSTREKGLVATIWLALKELLGKR